jgi:hypothetical protein
MPVGNEYKAPFGIVRTVTNVKKRELVVSGTGKEFQSMANPQIGDLEFGNLWRWSEDSKGAVLQYSSNGGGTYTTLLRIRKV